MLYIGAVLETDRPLCIVTEYMSGGSLYKYLHDPDVPKLTLQERLQIGRQISHSLVYIHNRRPAIIHRDIKSENVLIDDATGRAVLCDFDMSITVTHKAAVRITRRENQIELFCVYSRRRISLRKNDHCPDFFLSAVMVSPCRVRASAMEQRRQWRLR